MDKSLQPFFAPKGVVVVGASEKPEKLGYGIARNLVLSGYEGEIAFVNPKGGELFEREMYKSLAEVPDVIDLAVLLIPGKFVPQTLEECELKGIKAVIISSGGFRETGEEGVRLEQECLRIAKKNGMRLLGPNCIGVLDSHVPLDTTFLPMTAPKPGEIAFISHSGAICSAIMDWSGGQGFSMSRLISLGNQIDIDEADVLVPTAEDPNTKVLTLYLEGVGDGRKFVEQAAKASEIKPILALKAGRFESGQKAAASHTGALAGQDSAFAAAFRRAGVIRVNTGEEMFDWARALAYCPLPKGRNVAVLTNAGGPGVMAADALEGVGLRVAGLAEETMAAMKEILPSAASVVNPVDILASGSPEQYAECLQICINDPEVDSVMVILPSPPMFKAEDVVDAMIPVIEVSEKPVVVALMGERLIQKALERLRAARVPEYRFPERAAAALAALVRRAEMVGEVQRVNRYEDVDKEEAERVIEAAVVSDGVFLDEEAAYAIFEAYGLPVVPMKLAGSAEEAAVFAGKVGYPVVLKIASKDIPHKSDIGGVLVGLDSDGEVEAGFHKLMEIAKKKAPEAKVDGVYVQAMVPEGQEVILGSVRDEQFGPLVMFGAGGTEVEGLKDVVFSLAPVSDVDLAYMMESTWAGRKLEGFRNLVRADRQAVEEAITRLGQLVEDFPQIVEMEVNPLRVLADGEGAQAIDIRIRVN